LFDDLFVTRPVEHHHDHVLDTFVHGARDNRQRFGDWRFDVQRIAAFLRVLNHARPVGEL
jgi:hypothetical protein